MKTAENTNTVLELLRFTEAHNRHREALARATGERFNIFLILGVGHLEVKTHSPIIAELLNPKGKHDQGASFLQLFLTQFKIESFDAETATVTTEYYIGPCTKTSGGRIDILIKDGKGSQILIENKIYAADQENQIKRYRDFDSKAPLFYLTLKRENPVGFSDDDLKRIDCNCISYAVEVLAWLAECRKAAACLPNVRETISQYIHLIEELTNQSTNIVMSKELIDHITENPERLRAFYTLRDAGVAIQTKLMFRLNAKIDDLAKEIGLEVKAPLRESSALSLTTRGLDRHNLQICFEFQSSYRNFLFGFKNLNENQHCSVKAQLLSAFRSEFPLGKSDEPWWPAWTYWETPYKDWGDDAFEGICSDQIVDYWKAKLKKLARIAKEVCPDQAVTQIE